MDIVFKDWNEIVPEYIEEMFKPSLYRYSTRSKIALHTSFAEKRYRTKDRIVKKNGFFYKFSKERQLTSSENMLIQIIVLSHYY